MDTDIKTVKNETSKDEQDIAIRISGVKKRYKLGLITAGTLKGDIQSWWARVRGKEDPNLKIGAKVHGKNEVFWALNGIDLDIYKGERIGIIGHNGAGKSTLLKLLARVTGPTEGEIKIDGRITSMLEVGTGFNGELTGRENIYLNGAILGMTKKEVDDKIEQIIDFSECRQFIDTPVKRYSSGMFVKLAFAVASHLDSEIMIMDEVLAVGDMAFQKKCLEKMSEVSKDEGRTILYVSHNMNTIRQLCSRCIVLDHGKIVFNGDVEEAIGIYLGMKGNSANKVQLKDRERSALFRHHIVTMTNLEIDTKDSLFVVGSTMKLNLEMISTENVNDVSLSVALRTTSGISVARFEMTSTFNLVKGSQYNLKFELDTSKFAPGRYTLNPVLSVKNGLGLKNFLDGLREAYVFEIVPYKGFNNGEIWNPEYSGYILAPSIKVIK